MKDYINQNKKGICLVVIAILITIIYGSFDNKKIDNFNKSINFAYQIVNDVPRELSISQKFDLFFEENDTLITFYSNAFKIEKDKLKEVLKSDASIDIFNIEGSLDKFFIDYLLNLEKTNKEYFSFAITPNTQNKEYMVNLIRLYTKLYNIDFNIAAAIAEIESGYYAQSMLMVNNIFGGMSSKGLIKYKTIEYGIIRYIKLLHDGYFAKGLNTVEKIGYVYNPTTNEAGQKIATPSWVVNVNNSRSHYNNVSEFNTITDIISK